MEPTSVLVQQPLLAKSFPTSHPFLFHVSAEQPNMGKSVANRTGPQRGEEAMAGEHESVMVIRSVGLRRVARQLPQIPGGPR